MAKRLFGLPSCCDLVTILTRFYHLTNPFTGLYKRLMGIFQTEMVKIMWEWLMPFSIFWCLLWEVLIVTGLLKITQVSLAYIRVPL